MYKGYTQCSPLFYSKLELDVEIIFLHVYLDLAAHPFEYLPLFQCEFLWFYFGVSHTKLTQKAFLSHATEYVKEAFPMSSFY